MLDKKCFGDKKNKVVQVKSDQECQDAGKGQVSVLHRVVKWVLLKS